MVSARNRGIISINFETPWKIPNVPRNIEGTFYMAISNIGVISVRYRLPSCFVVCKVILFRCVARAERDGTRAETRFRLSPKRTSPFKSVGASVQSTAGSRGVRISLSNAGYTTFGGGVRVLATHSIRQFPLHFPSRASSCAIRFRTSSTVSVHVATQPPHRWRENDSPVSSSAGL